MAIKIIKNTLVDPINKVCEECGSEFTFTYEDIQKGTRASLFCQEISYRYVLCPVCKYECSFKAVKVEEKNNEETTN